MADKESKSSIWTNVILSGIVILAIGLGYTVGNDVGNEDIQTCRETVKKLEKALADETIKRVSAVQRSDSLIGLLTSKIVLPDTTLFPEKEAVPVLGGEVTIVCDSVVRITSGSARARVRVSSDDKTFRGISNPNVYKGDRRYFFFRGKKYILNVLGVKDYTMSDVSVYKELSMRQFGVKIRIYQAEEHEN